FRAHVQTMEPASLGRRCHHGRADAEVLLPRTGGRGTGEGQGYQGRAYQRTSKGMAWEHGFLIFRVIGAVPCGRSLPGFATSVMTFLPGTAATDQVSGCGPTSMVSSSTSPS